MSTAPRTKGGFGEVNHPHYGRLGPYLLHFFALVSPWGNCSSSYLVANGSNIAGLLFLVAGASPCFGSQLVVLRVWTSRSGSAGVRWTTVCQSAGGYFEMGYGLPWAIVHLKTARFMCDTSHVPLPGKSSVNSVSQVVQSALDEISEIIKVCSAT